MDYKLINANRDNIKMIIKYKLNNIFEYAINLSNEEIDKIKNYVNNHVKAQFKNYKMISVDNKIVGCILVEKKDDGVLLDEIFIEKEYRNSKIGSDIIKKVLFHDSIVYLWVYKKNTKAISLYKKLGFIVNKETETRYYMKYQSNNKNNYNNQKKEEPII